MAPGKRPKSSPLAEAKNEVRGALGRKDALIAEIISDCIDNLPARDISAFAEWIERFPARRVRVHPPLKITKYDDLCPPSFPAFNDLSKAIRWISGFLSRHLTVIKDYLGYAENYELAYLSGDYDRALLALDELEANLGYSIWLIEARTSLLQRTGGLEAQKSYVRSIHEAIPQSIPAFLAYYTSERNEESVSLDRFVVRMRNRIEQQTIPNQLKIFLQDRLVGRDDAEVDERRIVTTLSVASGFSIIDSYEALVDSFQTVFRGLETRGLLTSIKVSLMELDVSDFRLQKLRALISGDFSALEFRHLEANDLLLQGDYEAAHGSAMREAAQAPFDIEALAVAATASTLAGRDLGGDSLSPVQTEALGLLATLKAKRNSVIRAASDLAKLALNIRTLRVAGALRGLLAGEWFEQPQFRASPSTSVYLSTPYISPTHWMIVSDSSAPQLLAYSRHWQGQHVTTNVAAKQLAGDDIDDPTVPPEQTLQLNTNTALYHRNIGKALEAVKRLSRSPNATWRRFAAKTEIDCLLVRGDIDDAIRRVVAYCCSDDSLRHALPLKSILSGKRWRDLKHLAPEIALPIVLDIYWRTVDESEHDTNRRFAYDEFLRAHSCRRPSELRTIADRFAHNELVYFLYGVCQPQVMDVSFDAFSTSRAIEEERIQICALLSELDPDSSALYNDELKERTKLLSIQEGLRDFDQSRVHVNTEAVARWAEKETKEGFYRYKDLLAAGIGFGSPQDFDEAMRKLIEGDKSAAKKYLRYPEQEGDSLLIELFEAIKTEYLTNPDYGLDAYLSMRIRHGSLAGHLRGPLEERQLIVSKNDSNGEYQANSAWARRLRLDANSDTSAFYSAFREFSARYDAIIEDLTKDRLHIRKPEKPRGMFSLEIDSNPIAVHLVRTHLQADTSFVEFLELVFSGIQILLVGVLLDVRSYIINSVKEHVESAFESLRSTMEGALDLDAFSQLNSAVADVIPEVQAAIDRVAEWFVPVQKQQQSVLRTVEQIVEIGIEATKHAHRGFVPKFELQLADIGALSPLVLSEFTDILFTILDNVYCHSGNRLSPWVKLHIDSEVLDDSHRKVTIRVHSEVTSDAYTPDAVKKLERIRKQIETEQYRKRVNLEGGTGFLKLKRLVSRDRRESLEFGFLGTDAFSVEISRVLAIPTPERLNSSAAT